MLQEDKVINLKLEFEEMIQQLNDQPEREVYKLKILTAEAPVILAGIDAVNMSRQLYIDMETETWDPEQLKALPKWRGLSIKTEYFEKLGILKKRYFLILRQETEQSTEIFEVVLQNLVDHLMVQSEEGTLFSSVYKVLDRWRSFFQRGGYRKLTDEQQRGLFGELWFMQEWMNRFPGSPPLIVDQWEGPTSGRIDFKNSRCGIEIKTAVDKLTKTIKISNERQLKLTNAVSRIYIYVCFLEISKTHGISLQAMAEQVREAIASRSDRLALKFNDLLTELGFKEDEYADSFFFVEKTEVYEASENFPKISQEQLPVGISHVSYKIDLTHCSEFEREIDEVFEVF